MTLEILSVWLLRKMVFAHSVSWQGELTEVTSLLMPKYSFLVLYLQSHL